MLLTILLYVNKRMLQINKNQRNQQIPRFILYVNMSLRAVCVVVSEDFSSFLHTAVFHTVSSGYSGDGSQCVI